MKNIKSLIIGVFVMAIMLSPLAMSAQSFFGSDCFFKVEENNYYNRSDIINSSEDPGITNQTFGQPLPLGSGVAILIAAGAGYAIMKRRKNNAKN